MEIDPSPQGPPPSYSSSLSLTLTRFDNRLPNQLRPPLCDLGPLNRADGSARFSFGSTSALAAVYGPAPPRYSRKEKIDGAAIEVTVHPHKGQATSADKEKEAFIKGLLEETIYLERYPRTIIHLIIQVTEDDGGLCACVCNAAILAVMDAGIEMKFVPMSVSIAFVSPPQRQTQAQKRKRGGGRGGGGSMNDDSGGGGGGEEASSSPLPPLRLLLDPTKEESTKAPALVTMTINSLSDTHTHTQTQANTTNEKDLVSCQTMGMLTPLQFFEALEVAKGGARALLAFVRMTVEERARRTHKIR